MIAKSLLLLLLLLGPLFAQLPILRQLPQWMDVDGCMTRLSILRRESAREYTGKKVNLNCIFSFRCALLEAPAEFRS